MFGPETCAFWMETERRLTTASRPRSESVQKEQVIGDVPAYKAPEERIEISGLYSCEPRCSCGGKAKKNGRGKKRVVHVPHGAIPQILVVTRQRWVCCCCEKEIPSVPEWIHPKYQITTECFMFIVHLLGRPGRTQEEIAGDVGVSRRTVQRILDTAADMADTNWRPRLPEKCAVDDAHPRMKNCGAQRLHVITDHEGKGVVELLVSTTKEDLAYEVSRLPGAEDVSLITTDDARFLLDALAKACPKAEFLSDKFHDIRDAQNEVLAFASDKTKHLSKKKQKRIGHIKRTLRGRKKPLHGRTLRRLLAEAPSLAPAVDALDLFCAAIKSKDVRSFEANRARFLALTDGNELATVFKGSRKKLDDVEECRRRRAVVKHGSLYSNARAEQANGPIKRLAADAGGIDPASIPGRVSPGAASRRGGLRFSRFRALVLMRFGVWRKPVRSRALAQACIKDARDEAAGKRRSRR